MRIIALTAAGKTLADTLQQRMIETGCAVGVVDTVAISFKPKPFTESVQAMFNAGEKLVFICSVGIVFRTLAPVLKDKYQDPPVLVLDEVGQFVVPLLSGHEGGANELAAQVSKRLNASLVRTTAKPYLEPIYAVGMGCERDCPQDTLHRLLEDCLAQSGLSLEQIDSINSIDVKADETGLIELAKTCKKPFQTFKPEQLSAMEHLLSVKSDYVFKTVGVYGVAEAAALFAVFAANTHLTDNEINDVDQPELVLNKQKNAKATCAIARHYRKNLV